MAKAKEGYSLVNKNENIEYFVNSNNTILYIYNKVEQKITHIYKDKWASSSLKVKKSIEESEETLKEIISNENDFIKVCEVISSTLKPVGYFQEIGESTGLIENFLNEFIGGHTFLECLKRNIYELDSNPIKLLEEKAPHINTLLRNLFFNESNEILQNFLNWLNVVSFKDRNQDIIFSFFGTNEIEQGQGAGKGVLIKLLEKMFNGLVVSVSNNTYTNNFNSRLQNKKIVIFDEVDYKSLKYETIKDITGNATINIEYKGKESITSPNVSSWLMFSNMWDLHNKITIEDRRTFLIRPNPTNNSLISVVENNHNIDMQTFIEKLYEELPNFINIISLSGGKVIPPNQLKTKANIEYFNNLNRISINEIDSLYKILLQNDFREKIYELLVHMIELNPRDTEEINNIKHIMALDIMTPKVFYSLFSFLQQYKYIPSSKNKNKEWELLKEKILENKDWEYIKINMSATKDYERFVDNILIQTKYKEDKEDKNLFKKIQNHLRDSFGKKPLGKSKITPNTDKTTPKNKKTTPKQDEVNKNEEQHLIDIKKTPKNKKTTPKQEKNNT